MQVLVADDDEDIRFLVESMLARRGWQVTTTTSGTETIEALGRTSYDVVVLDQNMPPGSGLEVVEWLRTAGDPTPAVLFTGYVSAIDQAAVTAHGVSVLDKVSIRQLPDLLDQLTA